MLNFRIGNLELENDGLGLPALEFGNDESPWVFPKNSGFSPQIIHFNKGFSIINHRFWGTFILGNTLMEKNPKESMAIDSRASHRCDVPIIEPRCHGAVFSFAAPRGFP